VSGIGVAEARAGGDHRRMQKLCTRCGTVAKPAGPVLRYVLYAMVVPAIVAAVAGQLIGHLLGAAMMLVGLIGSAVCLVGGALLSEKCASCGESKPIPLDSPQAQHLLGQRRQ
jgi:hypothetical protein